MGGYVRLQVVDPQTQRVIYSARYDPETARTMAMRLTQASIRVEEEGNA